MYIDLKVTFEDIQKAKEDGFLNPINIALNKLGYSCYIPLGTSILMIKNNRNFREYIASSTLYDLYREFERNEKLDQAYVQIKV